MITTDEAIKRIPAIACLVAMVVVVWLAAEVLTKKTPEEWSPYESWRAREEGQQR